MRINVLKTFNAKTINYGEGSHYEEVSYDQSHVFEVEDKGINDVVLKDIKGGRDILMTKDYFKKLEEEKYIKKEGD